MTFSKFSDSNWASWAKILIITALAYAIESLVPALGASMLAIVLGMALSAWRPPSSTKPAKQLSGQLLKIGIVFLGFGLSLAKLQAVGLKVYLVLIPVVAVALLSARYLGRWMGFVAARPLPPLPPLWRLRTRRLPSPSPPSSSITPWPSSSSPS